MITNLTFELGNFIGLVVVTGSLHSTATVKTNWCRESGVDQLKVLSTF